MQSSPLCSFLEILASYFCIYFFRGVIIFLLLCVIGKTNAAGYSYFVLLRTECFWFWTEGQKSIRNNNGVLISILQYPPPYPVSLVIDVKNDFENYKHLCIVDMTRQQENRYHLIRVCIFKNERRKNAFILLLDNYST